LTQPVRGSNIAFGRESGRESIRLEVAVKALLAVTGLAGALFLNASAVRAQDDLAVADPTLAIPAPATVAPDAVLKMIQDKDPSITVVDTQPIDGYAEGHIPGAVNYPWVMRIKSFPISLPRNKTLVMYGSCPHDTEDLIRQLTEFGYTNIKVMDGGWYKWVALKYPAAGKSANPSSQQAVAQVAVPGKTDNPATR
jgi:rhodanese-related sulfurtransferase